MHIEQAPQGKGISFQGDKVSRALESALRVSSIRDAQQGCSMHKAKLKITPNSSSPLQGLKKNKLSGLFLLSNCSIPSIQRDILGEVLAQHKSMLGCCCFKTGPGIKPGIQHNPGNVRVLAPVWRNANAPSRVLPTQGFPPFIPAASLGLFLLETRQRCCSSLSASLSGQLQVGKGLKSWQGEEDGDGELSF